MNKIYKVVWNVSLGIWVAVAENTKSHQKRALKNNITSQKPTLLQQGQAQQLWGKGLKGLVVSISLLAGTSVWAESSNGNIAMCSNGAVGIFHDGKIVCSDPNDKPLAIAGNTDGGRQGTIGAIAVGTDPYDVTQAWGNNSLAMISGANAGENGIAIGRDARSGSGSPQAAALSANGAVALGAYSIADRSGDVALGEYSIASAVSSTNGWLTNSIPSTSLVSIGSGKPNDIYATRRLINLADGTEDSDAATVAQVKKVWGMLPTVSAGSNLTLSAVTELSNNKTNYKLSLSSDPTLDSVTVIDGDDPYNNKSLSLTAQGIQFKDKTNHNVITNAPSLSLNGISAGSQRITNVADADALTDAVNLKQLNAFNQKMIQYDLKKVQGNLVTDYSSLTLGGGQGTLSTTPNLTMIHNVAKGVANTDATNLDQVKALISSASGLGGKFKLSTGTGTNKKTVEQALNSAIQINGDGNITATANNDKGELNLSLSRALVLDSITMLGTDSNNIPTMMTLGTEGGLEFASQNNQLHFNTSEGSFSDKDKNKLNFTAKGITLSNEKTATTGPSLTLDGISAGGMVVSNVAQAQAQTDATNLAQVQDLIKKASFSGGGDFALSTGIGTDQKTVRKPLGEAIQVNGDGNITATADDQNGVLNLNLTRDLALDSVGMYEANPSGMSLKSAFMDVSRLQYTNFVENNEFNLNSGEASFSDKDKNKLNLTAKGITLSNEKTSTTGPSLTLDGIGAGGMVVSNVADGVKDSDAVNKKQLNTVNTDLANLAANVVQYDPTKKDKTSITLGDGTHFTTLHNLAEGTADHDATNLAQVNDLIKKASFSGGGKAGTFGLTADDGQSIDKDLNQSIEVAGGDNLKTEIKDNKLQVNLAKNLLVDSVSMGTADLSKVAEMNTLGLNILDTSNKKNNQFNLTASSGSFIDTDQNQLNLTAKGITLSNEKTSTTGPSLTINGIDAAGEKITNVAAGSLAKNSTDAINATQLLSAMDNMQSMLGPAAIMGNNGHLTWTSNIRGEKQSNVTEAIQAAVAQVVSTDPSLEVDSKQLSDGSMQYDVRFNNNSQGLALADNSQVLISAGGRKITNLRAGTNPTDAVNKQQLDDVSAESLQYDKNKDGSINKNAISLDASNGTTIHNVAAGQLTANSMDAVNGAQLLGALGSTKNILGNNTTLDSNGTLIWKSNVRGNPKISESSVSDAIQAAVSTVNSKDANLNVSSSVAKDGSTDYALALSATPSFNNVTTGASSLNNDGLTIVGGPKVLASGIDAGNKKITNLSDGVNAGDAINKTQFDTALGTLSSNVLNTAVFYDKNKDGSINKNSISLDTNNGTTIHNVAAGQLTANSMDAVNGAQLLGALGSTKNILGHDATLDSNGALVWKSSVRGNPQISESSVSDAIQAAVSTVNSKDANLNVSSSVAKDGSTDYALALSATPSFNSVTTGASSLNKDGLTIVGGPKVLASGIDAGNRKITNLSDGVNAGDAINKTQFDTALGTLSSNVLNTAVFYDKNKDGSINKNSISLDTNNGTTIHNVAAGQLTANSMDAINGAQLLGALGSTKNILGHDATLDSNGALVWKSSVRGNPQISESSVSDAIQAAVSTVNSKDANLNVSSSVAKDGSTDYALALSATPSFNSVTTGASSLNKDGLTIVGGPKILASGIDAGNRKITNLSDAINAGDATNLSQVQNLIKNIKGGGGTFALTADDGNKITKDLGSSIAVNGDSNISTQADVTKGQLAIQLSKNLHIDSLKMQDKSKNNDYIANFNAENTSFSDKNNNMMTLNAQGIKVSSNTVAGPSLTINGIDAAGGKITNVAAGSLAQNSTDAINATQLLMAMNNMQSVMGSAAIMGNNGNVTWKSDIRGRTQNNITDAIKAAVTKVITTDPSLAVDSQQLSDGSMQYNIHFNNNDNDAFSRGNNQTFAFVNNQKAIDILGINAGGRKIIHVADGTAPDDAATFGQLTRAMADTVQYDKNKDGSINNNSITLAGAQGTQIHNVADGELTASSTDAINGRQVVGIRDDLQKQINNNSADISALKTDLNHIGVGLVTQDKTTSNIMVASNTGGKKVEMSGTEGNRVVTGVADGKVAKGSSDVVTGNQLNMSYEAMAKALGGGAKFENGIATAPHYNVGYGRNQSSVNNVGDAIQALNEQNSRLDQKVDTLGQQVNNAFQATNKRIDDVEKRANTGIAAALSMEAPAYVPGKFTYAVGAANYRNGNAIGVSLRRTAENGRWSGHVGVAAGSDGSPAFRVGVSGVID
ncbi:MULTISPECIES: ESPR-type extended signal peptide-containing protein [unclassified Acinetobacter]|uniref:ESPR-type extended signal peptide-containing protein n=1 Tax=unclassified Acinetobacter TaxID=196816 RepID=UPI0029347FBD|nr:MULTISPECIES: ESPR-type extended signal peptide-containing protein [unclassified Acinetobacter]WOE32409.1 ESPR-type extended signal peptide-containing protein [Acinetobacter sp. SAAs470]WOE37883.1 ESPR-type extended signal peptide-containing protein [Acinetobacter sp. SAAs474]